MAVSKKIIYIANTRMPTEMAHGLQIMKMCESFVKNGAELELIVPMRFSISKLGKQDPFEYYRVERNFKIKKIPSIDLTPLNRFLGPISSLIQALSFSFFVFIYLLFRREAMAEGINKVLNNQDLANKISEQAYKDIQEYTWDNRAEKILKKLSTGQDT